MRRYFKLLAVFMVVAIFALGSNGCGGCGGSPSDTVKPTVAITSPNDGSTVSGTVTITAIAIDNVGVVKVEFYIDNNKVGEDTTSPYTYSWNTDNLQYNSQHTIQAKAYDNAGNVGESSIVTVTIGDPLAPQVTITNPQNGVYVSGTVQIQVDVVDRSKKTKKTQNSILKKEKVPSGIQKVEFYVDGNILGEDTQAPYEYSWDTTQVNNGTHTIMVKAIDVAGNNSSASINVYVSNPWQKTYGGSGDDGAPSIQQTQDGGYIVAGWTQSFGAGGYDVYILKLDSSGNLVWQKTYGGSSNDAASSIQQTSDGGYIVAGRTQSFGLGGYDAYILKLDSNGNSVWQKTYGGSSNDAASSIQQTSDGGYIVAGWTQSFGAGSEDAYILKLDSDGNSVWQKTYGGNGDDKASSIQQTSDGGYIVAGQTYSFGPGGYDVYILKLDSDGNLVWQKTYGGNGGDYAGSIQQTTDGGYIVAGWTYSSRAESRDVYILKLDSNGNLVWQKIYGGNDLDLASSIQQTSDGGYIVAGYTGSLGAGGYDVYILKLDSSGNLVWQKTYGGSDYDYAGSIQQTTDGGYIVAGMTGSFGAGYGDVYVLKLDSNGNTGPYPTSLSRKTPTKDKGLPFPFKK